MATVKDKGERNFRLGSYKNSDFPVDLDFNKIKVGKTTLSNDVALDLDRVISRSYTTSRKRYKRENVIRAIERNNVKELRAISEFFYRYSGIYSRLCRYMAYLFRYDLFITPMRFDTKVKD